VPVRELLHELLDAVEPHARELGCAAELAPLPALAAQPPARRQLEIARGPGKLPGLVEQLALAFEA
jgi:gamma-glutamyl:cysteine ligase YbdK (ATP-grasp superfamily)